MRYRFAPKTAPDRPFIGIRDIGRHGVAAAHRILGHGKKQRGGVTRRVGDADQFHPLTGGVHGAGNVGFVHVPISAINCA